ncbi:MAG: hypothetical protein ACKOY8_08465 [Verrucomicrobiota bacterium]
MARPSGGRRQDVCGDDTLFLEFIAHGWTPRLAAKLEFGRQALHASRLDFRSPAFTRTFSAPLAADMREFVIGRMGVAPAALDAALAE